jgi:hypothetical protein
LRVCDNYYPDVATGLTKRPGLRGISKLANTVADGTWFTIFRDDTEKYIIQFSKAGALKVWSANNGIQQTVNTVAAESITYATHVRSSDLQTLQINDYTSNFDAVWENFCIGCRYIPPCRFRFGCEK